MAIETRIQTGLGSSPLFPRYFKNSAEAGPRPLEQRRAVIAKLALQLAPGDNTAALPIVKHVIGSAFDLRVKEMARNALADIKPAGSSLEQFGFPVSNRFSKQRWLPPFYIGPLLELLPTGIGVDLFKATFIERAWSNDVICGALSLLSFSTADEAARFLREVTTEDHSQTTSLLARLRNGHSQIERYRFGRYSADQLLKAWSQS